MNRHPKPNTFCRFLRFRSEGEAKTMEWSLTDWAECPIAEMFRQTEFAEIDLTAYSVRVAGFRGDFYAVKGRPQGLGRRDVVLMVNKSDLGILDAAYTAPNFDASGVKLRKSVAQAEAEATATLLRDAGFDARVVGEWEPSFVEVRVFFGRHEGVRIAARDPEAALRAARHAQARRSPEFAALKAVYMAAYESRRTAYDVLLKSAEQALSEKGLAPYSHPLGTTGFWGEVQKAAGAEMRLRHQDLLDSEAQEIANLSTFVEGAGGHGRLWSCDLI